MRNRNSKLAAVFAASILSVTAFAAQPVPDAEAIAVGQAAIINAIVAGAGEHAPDELKRARASLAWARDSLARNDLVAVHAYARQVAVEAQLAESKAARVRTASVLLPTGN